MAGIGLGSAYVVGIVLETMFYGVYLLLFVCSMYLQVMRGRSGLKVSIVMFCTSIILFLSITAHWVVDLCRLFEAVVRTKGGSIDVYFADNGDPKAIVSFVLFTAEIVIGDIMMVYRLYLVYKRNVWICIAPTTTTIALAGCGSVLAWGMSRIDDIPTTFTLVQRLVKVCFALTLFNNIYCTTSIIVRLYVTHRSIIRVVTSPLLHVMKIFVESAALWAFIVILTFIMFLCGSNIQNSLVAVTSPIIGICFSLILVRLKTGASDLAGGDVRTSLLASCRPSSPIPLRPILKSVNARRSGSEPSSLSDKESKGGGMV